MYWKSSLLGHFKLSLYFREDSTAKDVSYLDNSGGGGGGGLSTIYIIM